MHILRRLRRSCPRVAAAVALCTAGLLSGAGASDAFLIEPSQPARVPDSAFFGTHFHQLVAPSGKTPNAWPTGEIGSLRLWDSGTRWADIEPAPGRFEFDRLDAHVQQARAHGANVMLVLGSAARWASARPNEAGPYGPGSAAEPADMAEWERYVTAVARRFKGSITQYELWNEPYFADLPADRGHPSAFFTGTVATMVELARRTRAVLDREDPAAVLFTPGFVGGVQRFEMFLAAGGAKYIGGVSYHFYADEEREFLALLRDVRGVMVRHGIAALPLYNTESGFAAQPVAGAAALAPRGAERRQAAALLARTMIVGAFAGLDRFYQYAWDNGRMGMQDDARHETPSRAAFVSVRRWLLGTTLAGCRTVEPNLVRCEGRRDGARLWIVWRPEAAPLMRMRIPSGAQVLSIEQAFDGPVSVSPETTEIAVGAAPVALWWR